MTTAFERQESERRFQEEQRKAERSSKVKKEEKEDEEVKTSKGITTKAELQAELKKTRCTPENFAAGTENEQE